MWPFCTKKKGAPRFPLRNRKVLVLVDWENLFYCLYQKFQSNDARIDYRIKKLIEWIRTEIGETIYSVVFAPDHMSDDQRKMMASNGFKIHFCPKRKLDKPERNPKSGLMENVRDTVDEELIAFATMMMKHPDVGYICLVSSDGDFTPMMEEARKHNIKRVLAPITIGSLSRSQKLVKIIDTHPFTLKKMVFRMDTV